jgi:hypothetical protein
MSSKEPQVQEPLKKKAGKSRLRNTAASALAFLSLSAAGNVYGGPVKDFFREWTRLPNDAEVAEITERPRPGLGKNPESSGLADEFAEMDTDAYVKSQEGESTFMSEFGYTEGECDKCSLLETDVARENSELAERSGIDPELALGIVRQESHMNGYMKNGKVKISKGRGYNEWQVTYNGFKEFWKILNRNKEDRYKQYIKEWSQEITDDRDQYFRDPKTGKYLSKKEAWKKVRFDNKANRIAGKTLFKFFLERENGDEYEALRDYNAGERGKNLPEYLKSSKDYASSVLGHKTFFEDTCSEMSKNRDFFRRRHHDNMASNYAAGTVLNNRKNISNDLGYYSIRK